LTPEESDALLDELALGEPPGLDDPAARLLAVLRDDVIHAGAPRDGDFLDEALSRAFADGLFADGVFTDGAFIDGVFADGAFADGLLADGFFGDGAPVQRGPAEEALVGGVWFEDVLLEDVRCVEAPADGARARDEGQRDDQAGQAGQWRSSVSMTPST
jgi:hypothetical protein